MNIYAAAATYNPLHLLAKFTMDIINPYNVMECLFASFGFKGNLAAWEFVDHFHYFKNSDPDCPELPVGNLAVCASGTKYNMAKVRGFCEFAGIGEMQFMRDLDIMSLWYEEAFATTSSTCPVDYRKNQPRYRELLALGAGSGTDYATLYVPYIIAYSEKQRKGEAA